MSVDLLLRVLPVVFTALTALGAGYAYYIGARKKELADLASLEAWLPSLADSLRMARYHNAIKRALDRVDGFFGEKPFGWRALTTCWLIAFVYPLMLFMLTWAAGGPHTLGVLDFLPEGWSALRRWGFVGGFLVYGCLLFLLVRDADKVNAQLREQLDQFFQQQLHGIPAKWRRPLGVLILGLMVAGLLYAMYGSEFFFVVAGAFILAVAVAGIRAGTTIAVAGAVAVIAFLVIFSPEVGIVFDILVFIFVIAIALTFFVSVSVAIVFAGAIAFAYMVAAYFSGGWAGVFHPFTGSVLVFLLILPVLNGLLDFASWGISRRLGRLLLKHFGRYTAIFLAFVDAVCAVLLLGTLAVVLCTAVEALNALALAKTGAEVMDLTGLLAEAAAQPFGSGFWITAMLFSTLIPTMFHLGIAVTSVFMVRSRSKDREKWIEKIEGAAEGVQPFSEVERGRIARYLFFHRVLGPLVLTVVLVVVFVWGWSAVVGDISNTLLALAEWSRGLVHGG